MSRINTQAVSFAYRLLPPAYQNRFDLKQSKTYSSLVIRLDTVEGTVVREVEADFFVEKSYGGLTVKGKDHYPCVAFIKEMLGGYTLALPSEEEFRVIDFVGQTHRRLRFDLREGLSGFAITDGATRIGVMAILLSRFIQDIMPHFDAFVVTPPQGDEATQSPIWKRLDVLDDPNGSTA